MGDVVNGKFKLSDIGKIVQNYWQKIPQHFTNTTLDEFVIMPNHLHGIVIIDNDNVSTNVETCYGMSLQKYNQFSKPIPKSLSIIINHFKSVVKRWCNKNKRLPNNRLSLPQAAGYYANCCLRHRLSHERKSFVFPCLYPRCKHRSITLRSNNYAHFQWQPRFYENIVRNDRELNRIREYIKNNPIQWKLDKENSIVY